MKSVLITKCIKRRSRVASGKVPIQTQEVVRICNEKITVFFLDSEKICKHLIIVLQCSYATLKEYRIIVYDSYFSCPILVCGYIFFSISLYKRMIQYNSLALKIDEHFFFLWQCYWDFGFSLDISLCFIIKACVIVNKFSSSTP